MLDRARLVPDAIGSGLTRAVLVVGLVVVIAGCGDGRVAVEGHVTFEGEPIAEGTIVFVPADGRGAYVHTPIEGGRYRLAGEMAVKPGSHSVRIGAQRETGRMLRDGDRLVPEKVSFIPAEYGAEGKLTCVVAPGKTNRHDFALTGSQPAP